MVSFDRVADEYAAGRPDHPDAIFDALEPLAGRVVLEGGAGTGIATRALLKRNAVVVPFDIGKVVLRSAVAQTPGLRAVVADGGTLPFRDRCADLVCFAQSWHWLDPASRTGEAARVLRTGGRWAGWWSHARGDGEAWFDAYWDLIERTCPGVVRSRRDVDESAELARGGMFDVGERVTARWTRHVDVETWLLDDRSRSFVMALPSDRRDGLLAGIRSLLDEHFPKGTAVVPYETRLWIGTKR